MSTHNTITVKGTGIRNEALAGEQIYPGQLVEVQSDETVDLQDSGGAYCAAAFAVEDDLQGNSIDDAYASGALVQYDHFRPGDWVQAVATASGAAIVIGDLLEAAGDGTLKKRASGVAIAIAREAIDTDSTSTVTTSRFLVEII